MSKRIGKLIAAGLIIFGSLFNLLGYFFGPERILWEQPSFFGGLSETLGWIMLLIAPIIYVIVDWENLIKK